MAPRRVLHIVGRMDRAGAETMLMNLYRHIDRTKIQFDFITFTNEMADYDSEIRKLGGKIIPIVSSNPISRMLKLKRFLKNHPEYKIVHAHMLLSNAFHLLAAKQAGIKNRISHSHSANTKQTGVIKKAYEKWALHNNRRLVTCKIGCGELAANYLFGSTKDVLILPNAIDIASVRSITNTSHDYIKKNFNDDGLKIIQVGRLSEVKNHRFSLEVAEQLKVLNVDFTLYIIGQGPLDEELSKQVEKKLLSDNVKFLGMRTDIIELMTGADYMIMPSLYEGFPVVLVESQSVGLKSIVSDQVSAEVDLGLGLVDFLPIDSTSAWISLLLENKKSLLTESEIKKVMTSHGFDVSINARNLAHLYMSL